MANAKDKTQKEKDSKGEVATTTTTPGTDLAVANEMFAGDRGAGMEGATTESFAIPFLLVLQKGSPQVDEASGVAIEGARQGMFFENVTGRMFDGRAGITVVPCHYRRVFLRWGPKGAPGSGFKGELLPEQVAEMRAKGSIVEMDGRLYVPLPDGSVNPERCDRIADVRNHYVLLVDDKGGFTTALVSLGSTQIKKSKMLMSALASVRLDSPTGAYQPATFANMVKATTVPESNDKGNWMGWRFEMAGFVKRPEVYAAAKAFHESVKKGTVEVKYEDTGEETVGGGNQHQRPNGF